VRFFRVGKSCSQLWRGSVHGVGRTGQCRELSQICLWPLTEKSALVKSVVLLGLLWLLSVVCTHSFRI